MKFLSRPAGTSRGPFPLVDGVGDARDVYFHTGLIEGDRPGGRKKIDVLVFLLRRHTTARALHAWVK